jgi:hypothetical protein
MTNHPKDRHVLAAAARAGVKVIVTYNLKDFPSSSLAPYAITAQGPSAFLKSLYDMAPSAVMQTLETQAAAIRPADNAALALPQAHSLPEDRLRRAA